MVSYGSNFDPDEVVSRTLEKGTIYLYHQFIGKQVPFRFSRESGVEDLGDWLLCVVGRPGADARSGAIGGEIQQTAREHELFEAMDDLTHDLADGSDNSTESTEDETNRYWRR